jgi:hypothetical protein
LARSDATKTLRRAFRVWPYQLAWLPVLDQSAAHDMAHGRINTQWLGVVDILIACQAAVDRLPQQGQEAVLLVLAEAQVFHGFLAHLGQAQCLVELSIR